MNFSHARPNRGGAATLGINVPTLGAVTLVAYICQAAFFGPVRYFLATANLEMLWYLPDLLGLICIAVLIKESPSRKFRALAFLSIMVLYSLEGFIVSGSVNSVLSTFKALVPLFCGLLLDRELLASPTMKGVFLVLLLIACAGVVYSDNAEMPWAKLSFEGIGVVQKYRTLQWVPGGQIRAYGFAGDEHGAASSIVTLFILFSINARKRTFYAVAAVALIAVYLTTSRTNLLSLLVYIVLYSFAELNRSALSQPVLRWSLKASFLAIVIPLIIIGIALSFSSETVPFSLLSLWIRGTFTWFVPFTYIEDLAPLAMVHGFGLGGFSFGLLQSDLAKYYTPIDNFILFNYLAFGVPYIMFYFYQYRRLLLEPDPYRIMIFLVTAIDGLTLRIWSDYPVMALYGYSTYSIFRGDAKRAHVIAAHKIQSDQVPHSAGRTSARAFPIR